MTTESEFKKRLAKAIEEGRDPAAILRELADFRAKEEADKAMAEAQKVVDDRKAERDRAGTVIANVQKQGEARSTFLSARDAVIEALAPIVDKARELPALQAECYSPYHDPGQLAWVVKLPEGYLPPGLTVPMLETRDGVTDSLDRAAQAVHYLSAGLGLLQSLIRVDRPFPERPATEFEAIEPETFEIELNCLACNHAHVAEINQALENGRPLRELEAQYGISRSTISRHKSRCLNLSAIRVRDDAL